MILETIKGYTKGYAAKIKCDYCGKEFTRGLAKSQSSKHYCNNDCASMVKMASKFGTKTYKNVVADCHCIVCGKPYDDSFYDKGDKGWTSNGGKRYLCSKSCRDFLYDTLDNIHSEYNKKIYVNSKLALMNMRLYEANRKSLQKYI